MLIMDAKKVTFNPIVIIYEVPIEERAGQWVTDRLHFQQRVCRLEKQLLSSNKYTAMLCL